MLLSRNVSLVCRILDIRKQALAQLEEKVERKKGGGHRAGLPSKIDEVVTHD